MNKIIMSSCQYKGYNTRVKMYNDSEIELTYYSSPMKVGKQDLKSSFIGNANNKNKRKKRCSNGDFSKRNLRASSEKLFGYILSNSGSWKTFITLTFADLVTDVGEANQKFHSWQVTIIQKYRDFKYICVPEFQKNGRVHYHLLTNIMFESEFVFPVYDDKGKQLKTFNKSKKKNYLVWNIRYWKHGYSTVISLDKMDDNFRLAKYMGKYLYKDFDNRLYGHQKVMVSKGLKIYDLIYSYDDLIGEKEIEYEMLKKGYSIYSEKEIEIESDNKYIPRKMTIIKLKKIETEVYNEKMEALIEDLFYEVEELKKTN